MRSRILVGAFALLACLIVATTVAKGAADPVKKWALINLLETTSIAGVFVSGPVMFIHDDAKMAQGLPCTGVYRFVPGKGAGEEIVSFHCKPRAKSAPQQFTAATIRDPYGPRVLTEYQFAGDQEAHGVPRTAQ
jgi:hypothetical protein